MNQDKVIFMRKCGALHLKNNEILVLILPFKGAYYLFLVPDRGEGNYCDHAHQKIGNNFGHNLCCWHGSRHGYKRFGYPNHNNQRNESSRVYSVFGFAVKIYQVR